MAREIMAALPVASPPIAPEPVTREELMAVLCAIVLQAKMAPGRTRSASLKVPAVLIKSAHEVIRRANAETQAISQIAEKE